MAVNNRLLLNALQPYYLAQFYQYDIDSAVVESELLRKLTEIYKNKDHCEIRTLAQLLVLEEYRMALHEPCK